MDLVYEALKILKLVLQARAPYDTGNLALNSIRIVQNTVVIGGEIAEYAIFTNEPWSKGKNPNESWVQRAIQEAKPLIQMTLNGRYSMEDIQRAKQTYQDILKDRQRLMVERLKELREEIAGEK